MIVIHWLLFISALILGVYAVIGLFDGALTLGQLATAVFFISFAILEGTIVLPGRF